MRNKYVVNHLLNRDGNYYFVRRVPNDLKNLYVVKRLCFSLKTKSYSSAIRMIKSVSQRLEDYWFGIRLQKMNVPAMHLIKTDSDNDNGPNITVSYQNNDTLFRPVIFHKPTGRMSVNTYDSKSKNKKMAYYQCTLMK